jgi:hypothetical protein
VRAPTCHPDRRHKAHGLCASCYTRKRHTKNPELGKAQVERVKAWRKNPINAEKYKAQPCRSPERRRLRHLKSRYGLTETQYASLLSKQDGVCRICNNPDPSRPLCVDHAHDSGVVRGLLCNRCNRALGLFGDDVEVLLAAAQYLRQAQEGQDATRI